VILLPFEKRWTTAALEAFAPPEGPGLAPRPGEVDYLGTYLRILEASNHGARLAMRFAAFMTGLSPVWLGGRLSTLAGLPVAERSRLVTRLLGLGFAPLAELATLLKLCACCALFSTPSVRERSGYDRR